MAACSGDTAARTGAQPLEDLEAPKNRPPPLVSSCARCHGLDGLGRGLGAFPKLTGQPRAYLVGALDAYARDLRRSGIMQPIAAAVSTDERQALAMYYAGLPAGRPRASAAPLDVAAIAKGEVIARTGVPAQDVPPCMECHGPGTGRRNPSYPVHAGQHADYLVLQLELFRNGRRGGSAYADIMRPIAARLTSPQMHAVALYYASLAPPLDGMHPD